MAAKSLTDNLPLPGPPPARRQSRWVHILVASAFITCSVFFLGHAHRLSFPSFAARNRHCQGGGRIDAHQVPQCPAQVQHAPSARPDITEKNVNELFKSDSFRKLSVDRLAGAVQIPTQTFQHEGPLGNDSSWDAFYKLEKYFRDTFPKLHEKLELEVVNEHGLLYTWHGSNATLKPILLMGHQDTVPVAEDTLSEWTYPPFSGYFDGTYINGRGSHDCKNNVVAILSSITALLEQDFVPQRTVVLSFGFDEEGGSNYQYGAGRLAKRISEIWGPASFSIIVDEGAVGVVKRFGRTFAIPQVAEKGYFDLDITVHVPGGHSSIPPSHTSIGILAEAITTIEGAATSNFPLELSPKNPFYTFLKCAAEDAHSELPDELREAIRDPKGAARVVEFLADDPSSASVLHTTQAVTIFKGGNKSNALPAFASALVNYRVSSSENPAIVQQKLIRTLKPVAEKFGLNFKSGLRKEDDEEIPEFTFEVSWESHLDPSPVSTQDSPSWSYFSGVIKHVFDEPGAGADVIVAPMLAGGNTDTRFYWDLSSQIYRFGPLREWHDKGWGGIHDVNERIALDAHLESILFYHEFIRVFDEAQLDGFMFGVPPDPELMKQWAQATVTFK